MLHRGSSQATLNTGKLKQDVLFKKLAFEWIGVNQGVVEGYISRRDHSPGSAKSLTFHIRPLVSDFFEHGENRSFWDSLSCYFFFDFLDERPDEKGVKAVVLGPESSDTEIKDAFWR